MLKPAAPFLTVENETGRIHRLALPTISIFALACGEFLRAEWVFPAKRIPIVDVKGYRDPVPPKLRALFQA